jgi:hypothetical protein
MQGDLDGTPANGESHAPLDAMRGLEDVRVCELG